MQGKLRLTNSLQCKLNAELILFLANINLILLNIQTKIIICFRYADQVAVGDEILTPGNAKLSPATVINLSSTKMQGDYKFYF